MRYLQVILVTVVMGLLFGVAPCNAEIITFKWDGNTEVDLDGYRLYQRTAEGTYMEGEFALDITDKTATNCSIVEDKHGTYYFALTAYDINGNESDFSSEVVAQIKGRPGKVLFVRFGWQNLDD